MFSGYEDFRAKDILKELQNTCHLASLSSLWAPLYIQIRRLQWEQHWKWSKHRGVSIQFYNCLYVVCNYTFIKTNECNEFKFFVLYQNILHWNADEKHFKIENVMKMVFGIFAQYLTKNYACNNNVLQKADFLHRIISYSSGKSLLRFPLRNLDFTLLISIVAFQSFLSL